MQGSRVQTPPRAVSLAEIQNNTLSWLAIPTMARVIFTLARKVVDLHTEVNWLGDPAGNKLNSLVGLFHPR